MTSKVGSSGPIFRSPTFVSDDVAEKAQQRAEAGSSTPIVKLLGLYLAQGGLGALRRSNRVTPGLRLLVLVRE